MQPCSFPHLCLTARGSPSLWCCVVVVLCAAGSAVRNTREPSHIPHTRKISSTVPLKEFRRIPCTARKPTLQRGEREGRNDTSSAARERSAKETEFLGVRGSHLCTPVLATPQQVPAQILLPEGLFLPPPSAVCAKKSLFSKSVRESAPTQQAGRTYLGRVVTAVQKSWRATAAASESTDLVSTSAQGCLSCCA